MPNLQANVKVGNTNSPSATKLRKMHASGDHTATELGNIFGLHLTSIYRYLKDKGT